MNPNTNKHVEIIAALGRALPYFKQATLSFDEDSVRVVWRGSTFSIRIGSLGFIVEEVIGSGFAGTNLTILLRALLDTQPGRPGVDAIEKAIAETEAEIAAEKLAGNVVKENYARGMNAGLRAALSQIVFTEERL